MKYETKMLMYNNAYLMIQSLIKTETDFKLIIYQNNDWDKDLPEKIKEEFNNKLLLIYKEDNIGLCEIDENGIIILSYEFENDIYFKELFLDDVYAVTNIKGEPLIINNFEKINKNIKSKEDIIELIMKSNISEEKAIESYNIFKGYN